MGTIKNDIFIFRLGCLTRTATVSYSTQKQGFTGDTASLYIIAMLRCTIQMDSDLIGNNVCCDFFKNVLLRLTLKKSFM